MAIFFNFFYLTLMFFAVVVTLEFSSGHL